VRLVKEYLHSRDRGTGLSQERSQFMKTFPVPPSSNSRKLSKETGMLAEYSNVTLGASTQDCKLSSYLYMSKSEGVGVATLNQVSDLIAENEGTEGISACTAVSLLMTSTGCPSQQ